MDKKYILAIDPGNVESAFVLMDSETFKPIAFDKVKNDIVLDCIREHFNSKIDTVVIEMVACYGKAVGKTVFDTCVWIGRFTECALMQHLKVDFIYRLEEKMNLCYSARVKDSNIRQALIDRFGGDNPIGVKKNPGYFYGFKADIWAAYAVGVTYIDKCQHILLG